MEDKEGFKIAISELSSKDKDKLIHRLLRKDKDLQEKLYFDLVSSDTADQRRDVVENGLLYILENYGEKVKHYHYLYSELRTCSGKIAHHVKICSDKFGDVYLNLLLVNETLKILPKYYKRFSFGYLHKTNLYLIVKLFKYVVLTKKLHEDYLVDLKGLYESISNLMSENKELCSMAEFNNFNVQWLDPDLIPEHIADIHKSTKASGLLR